MVHEFLVFAICIYIVDLLIPHHYLLRSGGTVSSTMEVSVYDTRADTINVEDISTDSNNQHVLRRLKRNEADDKKTCG